MRYLQGFLTFLPLICAWSSLALDCKSGKTYAVVVGIARYQNVEYNLNFCDEDAFGIYEILLKHNPAENLIMMINEEATGEKIMENLRKTLKKAGQADRVIFYFSGHGSSTAFLPYDTSPDRYNVLNFKEIKKIFHESKAGRKLLIADACLSGAIRENGQETSMETTGSNDLEDREVIVLMSSRTRQNSSEMNVLKHGIFTYYLIKGLRGASDTDKDRVITVKELYTYIREKVMSFTGNRQIPVIWGKFDEQTQVICW